MSIRIMDELQEVVDDTSTGVPAAQRAKLKAIVRLLVREDLVTYETSVLAVSGGLATGDLFINTAGSIMAVV